MHKPRNTTFVVSENYNNGTLDVSAWLMPFVMPIASYSVILRLHLCSITSLKRLREFFNNVVLVMKEKLK